MSDGYRTWSDGRSLPEAGWERGRVFEVAGVTLSLVEFEPMVEAVPPLETGRRRCNGIRLTGHNPNRKAWPSPGQEVRSDLPPLFEVEVGGWRFLAAPVTRVQTDPEGCWVTFEAREWEPPRGWSREPAKREAALANELTAVAESLTLARPLAGEPDEGSGVSVLTCLVAAEDALARARDLVEPEAAPTWGAGELGLPSAEELAACSAVQFGGEDVKIEEAVVERTEIAGPRPVEGPTRARLRGWIDPVRYVGERGGPAVLPSKEVRRQTRAMRLAERAEEFLAVPGVAFDLDASKRLAAMIADGTARVEFTPGASAAAVVPTQIQTVEEFARVFGGKPPRGTDVILSARKLYRELRHLVGLLEPLEEAGTLTVPGLATLNGPRLALELGKAANLGVMPTPDPRAFRLGDGGLVVELVLVGDLVAPTLPDDEVLRFTARTITAPTIPGEDRAGKWLTEAALASTVFGGIDVAGWRLAEVTVVEVRASVLSGFDVALEARVWTAPPGAWE